MSERPTSPNQENDEWLQNVHRRPYSTWEQLAGYFDGDGSVSIFLGKFTIAFYLDFADQSRGQLDQIVSFLRIQGIRTGNVHKLTQSDAYGLRIGDQKSVVSIAERLAPFSHKKRAELATLLDYRKHDLITGSEVQQRFKLLVELRMRERHGNRRFRPIPWAYSVGFRLSRKGLKLLSFKKWPTLSDAQKEDARVRHNVFGQTITALGEHYGVSRSAVWRSLKNGR